MYHHVEMLSEKFILKLKKEGMWPAIKAICGWFLKKLRISNPIDRRRIYLSQKCNQQLDGTVKYGNFRGLKLTSDSWWGMADRAAILFGLYEREVLESLSCVPSKYNIFINLGAADGYYGIGVLINKTFERSYCFEISKKGQEFIRENAILNNVLDQIEIRGVAKKDFYKEFSPDEIERAVLLIDIEGEEFDLLDKDTFNTFRHSIIFIELHDCPLNNGVAKVQKLKDDARTTHTISELTTTSRDLSTFEELRDFSDTDRWLICSEGRGRLMTWLRLAPLS